MSTDALDGKSVYSDSDGVANVTITGSGTIDLNKYSVSLGIVMAHNRNVTISGLTFKNMGEGHFIEMDASENVTIRNCTFDGGVTKAFANDVNEAINVDTPDSNTEGFGYDFSSQDRTPNKNVLIENCTFKNLQRAIGTHKYSQDRYHTNIVIRNNTFSKVLETCINMTNWKNSEVYDNTFSNIGSDTSTEYAVLVRGGAGNMVMYNTFQNFYSKTRTIAFNDAKNTNAGSEYATSVITVYESAKAAIITNKYTNVDNKRVYMVTSTMNEFVDLTNEIVAGPRIVTGLDCTGTTSSALSFSWEAVTGASKYEIFVDDGSGYVKKAETTATSATISGLAESHAYMVKVRANNGTAGLFGNELSVTTKSKYTPADVTGLKVSSRGTTTLQLAWNQVAGASGYNVYQYQNQSGVYKLLKNISGGTTATCSVTGLKAFTDYKFMVKAYISQGGTTYESTEGAVLAAGTTEAALKNVKATSNVNSIKFTWGKQASATGYDIELYDTKTKKYVLLTRIRSGETNSYTYSGLKNAVKYKVRIRSYRMINNDKIYTDYQTLNTGTKPSTQSGLSTKKRNVNSIVLKWKKQDRVSGYQIWAYNTKSKKWELKKTVTKGTTTSATISKLASGNVYKFRIRAYLTTGDGKLYGSYGSVLTTNTIPAKTTDLQAVSLGGSKVKLSWLKQPGVTGYKLYRYDSKSKSFKEWKTLKKNSCTITLKKNTTMIYKVRAYTKSGKLLFSGGMSDIYRVSLQKISLKSVKKSGKGFIATWSKCANMSGYEIQYSKSSDFDGNKTKTVRVNNSKTTKKTVKGLSAGKYYVRVRAYKTTKGQKIYSEWTKSKSIKVK